MNVIDQDLINQAVVARFLKWHDRRHLAQSYLLTGPRDIGKLATAMAVAKALNCENTSKGSDDFYCSSCPSCVKIETMNHPDIHVLEADGDTIKIEQIRQFLNQIRFCAFQAKIKIFIIKDIDKVTPEAGNALLKTLEEPSANSLILLTSAFPDRMLSTIRSRCHQVAFYPVSEEKLAEQLQKYYDIPNASTRFLAYFAEGCFGKAKRFYSGNILDFKNEVIQRFILTSDHEGFIKTVTADKDRTGLFLDIVLSWVRDMLFLKVDLDRRKLIFIEHQKDLEQMSRRYTLNDIQNIWEQVVNIRKLHAENLNIKIPLAILKESLWDN
ncbi:MAG: AAA family ATPase [Candidatus Omnitrophica bacterium]|nr:AAA family ATPase [Candidatus Omnitrophota bacterium]